MPRVRNLITLILTMLSTAAIGQQELASRGAWDIAAEGEDFALRTPARDAADTTLALLCRKEHRAFAFEIKSAALAARPPHEEIRVGFKVDDDDQTWFSLSTGPGGTVPISHPTAFWIVHAALLRGGAKEVAFTAGDHAWRFSLEGFAGLIENLTTRCGFEPARGSRGR